jgi:peptide/nickel transport system permease protein
MVRYILRRLTHGLLILIGVSFLTFFLINQSPGSYLDKMRLDPQVPAEFIKEEFARLGLDKPWIVTYGLWLKGIVLHLDFGKSFAYKQPVFDVLKTRALNTFLLGLTSLAFAWGLAIPLGILAGYKQYSWFDKISSAIVFIGLSIPEVFMALLAIYFAAVTGWFPTGGLIDVVHWDTFSRWAKILDVAHHLVLPTLVLGIATAAIYMRQMRGNLLDVLRADFVRTARAKGLSERLVLFRHAVRNAINPLITLFGFSISELLSGAVLVEQVTSYPGLGLMTIEAFMNKDIYLVMAAVLTATVMLILGNLMADILLAWTDPRIRLEDVSSD